MEHSFLPIAIANTKVDVILEQYYKDTTNQLQHCANHRNKFIPSNNIPSFTPRPGHHQYRIRHRNRQNSNVITANTPHRKRGRQNGRRNHISTILPPSPPPIEHTSKVAPIFPSSRRPPNRNRHHNHQSTTRRPLRKQGRPHIRTQNANTRGGVTGQNSQGMSPVPRKRCHVVKGVEKCNIKKRCKTRKCREKRKRRKKMRRLRDNRNIPEKCRDLEYTQKRRCIRRHRRRLRNNRANSVIALSTPQVPAHSRLLISSTTPSSVDKLVSYSGRDNRIHPNNYGVSVNNRNEGSSVNTNHRERWPFPKTPSWSKSSTSRPIIAHRRFKPPKGRNFGSRINSGLRQRRRHKFQAERQTRRLRGRNLQNI